MNNTNISRRSLLALGLNGTALLALAGCGGSGEAPAPEPASVASVCQALLF